MTKEENLIERLERLQARREKLMNKYFISIEGKIKKMETKIKKIRKQLIQLKIG